MQDVIGLHPHSSKYPAPGTSGAVGYGLETYTPVEDGSARLAARRVRVVGDIIRFDAGNVVALQDLDGTPTYLHEFPPEMVPESGLADEGDSGPGTRDSRVGGRAPKARARSREPRVESREPRAECPRSIRS